MSEDPEVHTTKGRLVLLQTVATDYNAAVFERLRTQLADRFELYAGSEFFDTSVLRDESVHAHPLKNRFLFGRRLLWQSGPWRELVQAESAVLEYNPRILSTWALLVMRRIMLRRTVLWGHAWPRAGRRHRTVWIRRAMAKLSDAILVYTETQARELKELMPNADVRAAPNALYSASAMRVATAARVNDIICVGRLVRDKKPMLLVEAFASCVKQLPSETRLLLVGDGAERAEVERYITTHELQDRVVMFGHDSKFENLRRLYAGSLVSVSPGYVGLSIMQSFAFGVPMLIARNEPHAPEIEAAIEGKNSLTFQKDNPNALATTLLRVFAERDRWLGARDEIALDCAQRYSIELMAQRIIEAVDR